MPASLQKLIDQSIMEYPSLYKTPTYAASRMNVLLHLFLTIGNGFEWVNSRLVEKSSKRRRPNQHPYKTFKTIPPNYFEMDLYEISMTPESLLAFTQEYPDKFYYTDKFIYRFTYSTSLNVTVQSDDQESQLLCKKFADPGDPLSSYVRVSQASLKTPDYIGDYSALTEMAFGRTVEGELLKLSREYIEAGQEVALYGLRYWHTKSQYQSHYFKNNKSPGVAISSPQFKLHRQNQMNFFKQYLRMFPASDDRKRQIDEFCQISWS